MANDHRTIRAAFDRHLAVLTRSGRSAFAVMATAIVLVIAFAPELHAQFLPWQRITDGLEAPGFQDMRAVTVTTSGKLVAVGHSDNSDGNRIEVWTSLDGGSSWQRKPDDLGPGIMLALTTMSSGRLIALGRGVWTSDDEGNTWARGDSTAFRTAEMYGVVETATGALVAVGYESLSGRLAGVVVHSFDGGTSWTREDLSGDSLDDPATSSVMFGLMSTRAGRLIAFGFYVDNAAEIDMNAAWTSDDGGITWTRHALTTAGGSEGICGMIETTAGGLIAVGVVHRPSPEIAYASVAFTSSDHGDTWTPSTDIPDPIGYGYEWLLGIAHYKGATIAVGDIVRSGTGEDPSVWISVDEGRTWTRYDDPFQLPNDQLLYAATVNAAGAFVLVGTGYNEDVLSYDAAVWVSAPSNPDLIVEAVSSPPTFVAPGGSFIATDTTFNQGVLRAAASRTRYYLSLDDTMDAVDLPLIPGRYLHELGAGERSAGTLTLRVSSTATPGTYTMLACADGFAEVVEIDETNNCLAAATATTVIRPDLQQLSVSDPPATAIPGSKFIVTDTVRNPTPVSVLASSTRYYVSSDELRDAGDVLLTGKRPVPKLLANTSNTGKLTITVPSSTPDGSYYLLACADDSFKLTESDETNNCAASSTTVLVGWPDLVVTEISNPPSTAIPGGKFTIFDTVRNQGTIPAGVSYARYYLSVDGVKNAGDVLLMGMRAVESLASGASSLGSRRVTVPSTTPLGTYRVLACADDTSKVPEQDNESNCRASATMVTIQ